MTATTTDCWPGWARPQLLSAVTLAAAVGDRRPLVTELYERWYAGRSWGGTAAPAGLVGRYRRAHAETATTVVDGLSVLARHDALGRDGWWRTWNTGWRPRRSHDRVLLSPRPDALDTVVTTLTAGLRDVPYLLTCPADPQRLARSGAVVLHVPDVADLGPHLIAELTPQLRADTPPLCLPLAPGLALAQYPDNGMTFGEHRCHLVALALTAGAAAPRERQLARIADVFSAHGIDPARPYRAAR